MPIHVHKHDQRSLRHKHLSFSIQYLATATLSIVILFGSVTALAGIYKWTDAEGNVHYGSQKPAEAAAEKMRVDTRPTGNRPGAEALDMLNQEVDDQAEKIKEEGIPAEPPVPSLPMKEVKRRCADAKNDLVLIMKKGQLRERDEEGNISYVSDKERQRRINEANKQIREYCN